MKQFTCANYYKIVESKKGNAENTLQTEPSLMLRTCHFRN